jgi:hypothetical protein
VITLEDLQAAIAECLGVRNPTANTAIKLAAFYTIKNELFGKDEQLDEKSYRLDDYSYASQTENTITLDSGSEFSQVINGKSQAEVLDVIDELMQTLQVINPRLYAGVMRKLQ